MQQWFLRGFGFAQVPKCDDAGKLRLRIVHILIQKSFAFEKVLRLLDKDDVGVI